VRTVTLAVVAMFPARLIKRPVHQCVWALSLLAMVPNAAVAQTAQPPSPSPSPSTEASAEPASVNTLVPRHTIIPIAIVKDIRVGGAGDERQAKTIKAEVAQDVIIDGLVIAKEGDLAEGHLTTEKNVTHRMFSADTSQEAALDIDDVVNFCGDTIHMQFERTYVGGVRGGAFSFGPHAHDAVFSKGSILKAESDRVEKSVCAEKTSRTALPLPGNIIVPDEEVQSQ
jgi:hypothetical protein